MIHTETSFQQSLLKSASSLLVYLLYIIDYFSYFNIDGDSKIDRQTLTTYWELLKFNHLFPNYPIHNKIFIHTCLKLELYPTCIGYCRCRCGC